MPLLSYEHTERQRLNPSCTGKTHRVAYQSESKETHYNVKLWHSKIGLRPIGFFDTSVTTCDHAWDAAGCVLYSINQ